jgi:hypothetical protein
VVILKHVVRRVFQISIHDPFSHDDHYRLHGIYAREMETSVGMQNFSMTFLQIGPTQSARNLLKLKRIDIFGKIRKSFSCHYPWIKDTRHPYI